MRLLKFALYMARQAIVTNDAVDIFIIIIIIIIICKNVTKLRPRFLIILLIQFHFSFMGSLYAA